VAASHVGWNLFAPVNGLHEIDEFDSAKQTAALVASVAGLEEIRAQVKLLKQIGENS
jgi:hypothetical protein